MSSKQVRSLLIDLDNCLLPCKPNYVPYVNEAIVEAVLALDEAGRGLFLGDRVKIKELVETYFEQYGQSIRGFSEEHKMSPRELSETYHGMLDFDVFVDTSEGNIERLGGFCEDLSRARRDGKIHDYRMFTQAPSSYAQRFIDKFSLSAVFPDNKILSADRYGYNFKHCDGYPYKLALRHLDGKKDPRTVMLLDDSRSVLKYAFDHAGIRTCHVTNAPPLDTDQQQELPKHLAVPASHIGEVFEVISPFLR